MQHALFSIEGFLAFLDKTPDEIYETNDSNDCAFARYLRSHGMRHIDVGSKITTFVDQAGTSHKRNLPPQLGYEHCRPGSIDRPSTNSYGELARRIRVRMDGRYFATRLDDVVYINMTMLGSAQLV